jgi:hypothetical protein
MTLKRIRGVFYAIDALPLFRLTCLHASGLLLKVQIYRICFTFHKYVKRWGFSAGTSKLKVGEYIDVGLLDYWTAWIRIWKVCLRVSATLPEQCL